MSTKKFILTPDHIKLAKNLFIEWSDRDYEGAPCVNIKRPYGNGWVSGDIAEILGWEIANSDDGPFLTEEQQQKATRLHRDMQHALQIILCTQSFATGEYERGEDYDALSWRIASDSKSSSGAK